MKFKRHFFVCMTNRPPFAKPSCGARGSADLLAELSAAIEGLGLTGEIAVTPTGCLGPCETGPTMVVYPEGVWYQAVKPEDIAEIASSHGRDGKPVERLRYTWPG